jgi:hypothetical protein
MLAVGIFRIFARDSWDLGDLAAFYGILSETWLGLRA